MATLKYSDVRYNDELHTYTRPDGKFLSGITGMIDRQINGGKFAKMDQEFLRPYAEYGSKVHNEIEVFYTVGIMPETPEALAWINWYGKRWEDEVVQISATEYTVTDNEHFATNVDFVDKDGFGYNIWDFKTSSILDKDSLSWQLSICAELFNIQNGFYPAKLFGVHLRGNTCNVVEIDRKPTESVLWLLEAEIQGERYIVPQEGQKAEIRQLLDLEQCLIRIKQEAEYYEQQKAELLAGLEKEMDKAGLKKFETDSIIITKVLPTQSKGLDTSRLKAEQPELCKGYEKISERKGYLKLTIK